MISVDYFVILGIVLVFSFIHFYFGKNKSISTILSLYIAIIFYEKADILKKLILKNLDPFKHSINEWLIYLGASVVIYLLISKHIHSFEDEGSIVKSIIYGVSISVFVLSISYFLIPSESIYNFGSHIDSLFIKNIGFAPYILAPLVILLFI
jgi:hypothetical protein